MLWVLFEVPPVFMEKLEKYQQFLVEKITLQPLYNMVCYNTVLDITWFEDGSKKYKDYIEK